MVLDQNNDGSDIKDVVEKYCGAIWHGNRAVPKQRTLRTAWSSIAALKWQQRD
jgi:hypothetical protein